MNTGKRILVSVILIAVIAIGGAWWLARERNSPSDVAAVGSLTPSATPGLAPHASVVIDDQFPGRVVYVTSADVGQGTWVAIYSDADGQPDRALGAGYFDATTRVGQVAL